jgi:hypothetical protein
LGSTKRKGGWGVIFSVPGQGGKKRGEEEEEEGKEEGSIENSRKAFFIFFIVYLKCSDGVLNFFHCLLFVRIFETMEKE